jgi:galactose mutarotase-like enzyme
MDDARRIDFELEISDTPSGTRASVAPNRGGMVTRFSAGGRDLLFMDRSSFVDPAKNVRGGNPVLFPTPGKLVGDAWSRGGLGGSLGQHGLARSRAWSVVDVSTGSVALRLEADDTTRASYPWDFRVDLTYAVADRALSIEARIENRSTTPMPFGFGFHPYFVVPDKRAFVLASGATRAFDNVTKQDVAFDARSLDVAGPEVDLHLLDHDARTITFSVDAATSITIDGGVPRPHWVLWSLPGRDFVCVEPWTCPGNAMNTGERLIELAPGASRTLSFRYQLDV